MSERKKPTPEQHAQYMENRRTKRANAPKKERVSMSKEERAEANRESQRKYREANKEKIRVAESARREGLKELGGEYSLYLASMTPERREDYERKRKEYRELKNTPERRDKHRLYYLNNADKYVLKNIEGKAKRLGIPFNIDETDIVSPEFCPILGIKLERGTGAGKTRAGDAIANSPSVDRIIPDLGYVKGNVIVISYKANRIKNNATVEELLLVADFYRNLEVARQFSGASNGS